MESRPPSYTASRPTIMQTSQLKVRQIAAFFAFVGISFQTVVAVNAFTRDIYYGDGYDEPWGSPESIAFFGISICWNVAEFITVRVRKNKSQHYDSYGIHPGAHVGLDLILWMGFLIAAILQLLINFWYALSVVASVVEIICCIIHFILFVQACRAVDRRRKLERAKFQVPPGMALVPVQTLAELQSGAATRCEVCGRNGAEAGEKV